MVKKKKRRKAKMVQPKGKGQVFAECRTCLSRGRRGGYVVFKNADSQGRNTWWKRHKNHHIPKPAEYGVRC